MICEPAQWTAFSNLLSYVSMDATKPDEKWDELRSNLEMVLRNFDFKLKFMQISDSFLYEDVHSMLLRVIERYIKRIFIKLSSDF